MSYSYLDYLFFLLLLVLTTIFARLLFKVFFNGEAKSSKSMHAETSKERPLDCIEYLLDELQSTGGGNVCVILCLKSKISLQDDHIHQALVILSQRQPMLRTVIVRKLRGNTTEKYFKLVPQDKPNIDIQRSKVLARDWVMAWPKIVCSEFDTEKGPLWRANILQEEFLSDMKTYLNTILFVFSHSAVDGISSLKFCEQFLCNLNAIAEGCVIKEVQSLPMLPGAAELVSHKTQWPQWQKYLGLPRLSRMLLRFLIPLQIRRMARNPFYSCYPPPIERKQEGKPMIEVCELTKKETSKLIAACKRNGCTVHGAMLTACNIAFSKLIARAPGKGISLESSSAVNVSRDCWPNVPEDYLGNFVAELRLKLPAQAELQHFWGSAKRTTVQLHEKVKRGLHLKDNVAMVETVGSDFFASEILSSPDPENIMRMSTCFLLSNAGRFVWKASPDQHFQPVQCFFTAAGHRNTTVCCHFIVTVNGKLSWVVSYNDALVSAEQANEFLQLSVHELLKNCESEQ